MKFEEAMLLLREGKKVGRTDKMYDWDYLLVHKNKVHRFWTNNKGVLVSKSCPKIGRGLLDNKWCEYNN